MLTGGYPPYTRHMTLTAFDPRFTRDSGREIFGGSELLVKGALESDGGVHLMTGYPGSPIAEFFDTLEAIGPLLNEKGISAKIANNEAMSVAMVNGAQMVGARAISCFKSVGLHVASDALALGVLSGTLGDSGGLIICGDDPWSDSTQVPADSRFLAEHLRMPFIEPATPQEVKDWVNLAFKLGQAGNIYMGYGVTVVTADGGGTVECKPNQYPELNEHQRIVLNYERDIEPTLEQRVLLPPRSWQREVALPKRFAAVMAAARKYGINAIFNSAQKDEVVPLGFIASGVGFAYLRHALAELGLTGRIPILRLGMSYPVDEELVTEFARQCRQVVVVEERRSFVERQVIQALAPLQQSGELKVEIYGKRFPGALAGVPDTRGLNPPLLIERLVPLIRDHASLPIELTNGRLSAELERIELTGAHEVNIPLRTPTFCPGCPHRDSASSLLELRRDLRDPVYMEQHHKRKPIDLVCHGDTGCYTMFMFEPNKPLMHNYSGMGLGGSTGAGADPFIDNKQLVFLGDGTFFHSGMLQISQSIAVGQDITYIILDNKTTAMTGHQTNPSHAIDLRGNPIIAQDVERVVTGMMPKQMAKDVRIVRINPADRDRYRKLLEETLLADGVKIVIADKECGITFHRRARSAENKVLREQGFVAKKKHMNVATEVCEYCLECTQQTGCPGLTITDTDFGPKIQTDFSWCVNDGACQRIDACPAFEEVTILRKQAPRHGDEHVDLTDLPDPPRPIHADQDIWRCYLAGVGGMGIGLCNGILSTAGHAMGYHVQFLNKKGLAIRNGGVFSQLVFTRQGGNGAVGGPAAAPTITPVIPYGKADLLLGVDLLEATRGLDPKLPYRVASPDRTGAVVNTAKTPTILTLMGDDDFDPADLEDTLKRYTHPDYYIGFNVGDLCERMLDSKLYANIMMLGVAYQKGLVPLTRQSLEDAIRRVARHDSDRNLRAFNIGRKIVVRPELFVVDQRHKFETARQAMRRKTNTIRAMHRGKRGAQLTKQFRVLLKQTFRATRGRRLDDALARDVIIRAYNCFLWGGIPYAKRYCDRMVEVFEKDTATYGYKLTRAAAWNLAKVMLIKDELYVPELLTHPEKYRRDRKRFNVNPAHGDRIIYKHFNVPEIHVFGKTLRLPAIRTRDWQQRLLKRMRFLRPLLFSHPQESAFRDWYENELVARVDYNGRRDYERWCAILSVPEAVTGYREVRYPKMASAKKRAEKLLVMEPDLFEPQITIVTKTPPRGMPLPIMTMANV